MTRRGFIQGGFLLVLFVCAPSAGRIPRAMPVQAAANSNGDSGDREKEASLAAGDRVERLLGEGESHAYRLRLGGGRAVDLVVEQLGIDLVVEVFGRNGRPVILADRTRADEAEEFRLLADREEDYRLVISAARQVGAGSYRLLIGELRGPSETDKNRFAAESAYAEAEQLRSGGRPEGLRGSIEHFLKAAALWHEVGDYRSEARARIGLGMARHFLGEREKALESLEGALSASREGKNGRVEAEVLTSMGVIHESAGRTSQALQYHSKALSILEGLGDSQGIATALNNIGWVLWLDGQPRKALEFYLRALPLWRDCGDGLGESATLHNMGFLYSGLGDPGSAQEHLTRALELRRTLRDRSGAAQTLTLLGRVQVTLGEHAKALDYYAEALEIVRAVGDLESEAWLMNSFGFARQALDRNQEALDAFAQALALFEKAKNPRGKAEALNGIGGIFQQLGDYGKALEEFEEAHELYRKIQNPWGEATALSNIGSALFWMGNLRDSLEHYTRAESLFRQIEDRQSESNTLSNIGVVHVRLGEPGKSLEYFERALMLRRSAGERGAEANTHFNMGLAYEALGDTDKALAALQMSNKIWREIGSRQGDAVSLVAIGAMERRRGNIDIARSGLESALEIVDSVRESVFRQELRASYFSSIREFYLIYIDILMELHKRDPNKGYAGLALEASERSRARGLLEILVEAKVDIRQGVDVDLVERERALRQKLNARERYRVQLLSGRGGADAAEAVRLEVVELLGQLSEVEAQIRSRNPRYAALTQPVPLNLSQIQAMLDPETTLLEYALGKDRSFLWMVSSNELRCFELPGREQIEREAKRVYELWGHSPRRELRVQAERAASQLSRSVLGPLSEQLNANRLLIVADGVLQYIPFAALPIPHGAGSETGMTSAPSSRPLSVDHEVVMLPSASAVEVIRRDLKADRSASKTVAVLADPVFEIGDSRVARAGRGAISEQRADQSSNLSSQLPGAGTGVSYPSGLDFERLPFTRREADAILKLVPGEDSLKALDFEASRSTVTDGALESYGIVHFATHGVLDSQNPGLSGIVLSLVDESGRPQNGFLRAHEIYNLRLSADLVVLSGCRTALGQEIRGEGLLGLTRGFMYAGAPRVVASLWDVRDQATSELMTHFYRGLLKDNLPPAAALRQAQLVMRRDPRWTDPYFWAGFVLQGDWK